MRTSTCLCLSFMLHSASLGGTVTFDPPSTLIYLGDGGLVSFDVSVAADGSSSFDTVDILFGSDWPPIVGFEFAPEFVQGSQIRMEGAPSFNTAYAFEWSVSGVMSAPINSILMGTLTLEMSWSAPGEYYIIVDSDRDGGQSHLSANNGSTEGLIGGASVATPEPATLTILAIASVLFLRRRETLE